MIPREHRAVFEDQLQQRRRGRPRGIGDKVSTGLYISGAVYRVYYEKAKRERRSLNDVLSEALEHRASDGIF